MDGSSGITKLNTLINDDISLMKPENISAEQYKMLYERHSLILNENAIRDIDHIPHNEKIDNIEYKYGIPVKNSPISDKSDIELYNSVKTEEFLTATENLYELLGLDKESSFESLILKYTNEFKNGKKTFLTFILELDMYGDVVLAGQKEHAVLKYGIPIPLEILHNDAVMQVTRNGFTYNVDLPGNLEDVHPNKFIANLRPVEEFKHTPIVPISEKEINEYKKKIAEKSRKAVFFEVKKQTLYYYGVAAIFIIIVYNTFSYFYKEGEKVNYEVEKLRLRRYRYRQEEDIY